MDGTALGQDGGQVAEDPAASRRASPSLAGAAWQGHRARTRPGRGWCAQHRTRDREGPEWYLGGRSVPSTPGGPWGRCIGRCAPEASGQVCPVRTPLDGPLTGRRHHPSLSVMGDERQAQGGCGAGSYEPGRACQSEVRRPPHRKAVGWGAAPSHREGPADEPTATHANPCKVLVHVCKSEPGSIQSLVFCQERMCVCLAGSKKVLYILLL